jgi:energy-coupling factor transporter ATP-binding protein EcfA2
MPATRLRWLQIHQYEQFEPVRIEFSARENLLLGINGAGKTRLLWLLRAVLSLNFGDLLGTAFDVEFEAVLEADFVPGVVAGRVKNCLPGEVDDGVRRATNVFTASLRWEREGVVVHQDVHGDEATYRIEDPDVAEGNKLLGPGNVQQDDSGIDDDRLSEALDTTFSRLAASYLGESEREFRALSEALEFTFRGNRVVASSKIHEPLAWDLFPLISAFRSLPKTEEVAPGLDLVWLSGLTEISFLTLFPPLGMRTVKLMPRVVRQEGKVVHCRGLGFECEFLNGNKVAESELTFGQRRYLYGGIVSLMRPGAAVLVDEIDNGMHPRLIETLLKLWEERQVFLVSHNKLVIDYVNFDGPEDVQRKVHIVQRGEDGRQIVKVLDAEVAGEVYKKIAVAIQSPSDVLRAEGLW